MPQHWITAKRALEIIKDEAALLDRLSAGMIRAKAAVLKLDGDEQGEAGFPASWWKRDRYHDVAMNWETGDFTSESCENPTLEAFGVQFDATDILAMLPVEQRASAAISLSVVGSSDWVSAEKAASMEWDRFQFTLINRGDLILEQARLGFLSARAVLAQCSRSLRDTDWYWEQREWDVPNWFWLEFTHENASSRDWNLGKFAGRGQSPEGPRAITLSGVHFHRATLDFIFRPDAPPNPGDREIPAPPITKGRRPVYDWATAVSTVWRRLYSGELIPVCQADVERALIVALSKGDDEPSEAAVRPYAKRIYKDFSAP